MRRLFTHGAVSLALATLFAVGASAGASAAATSTGAHAAVTASAFEAASSQSGVETLPLTTDGSVIAPTSAAHALRPSGVDASTLLAFWVGGGALALATAAVLVSVKVRRMRKETDSAK
ncbi:hypothetical protein RWH44_16035 [Microbacterium sp. KSW2-29]|uniref:Gram-positive cocci surface proteins LPxTG domain-containing protein n=1 Tax=Microbacterium phycohabitans TaxID=3075993 RepID=A0ABU3SR66_9MICO|nr:hypothetical protein [Microbacterium sp. KSW2-29]MDU0347211.1 hypothetical protein [Microbacterium sp. KSW2-29]